MLSEEIKALVTMLRHRALVAASLRKLATRLASRADGHDLSKFGVEQFAKFVGINRAGREHRLGSPENNAVMQANHATIGQHYRLNSHHPEHYEGGVDCMGLADFIEMVVDWEVASAVYGRTTMSEGLPILAERFGLDERHPYLIDLIREELKAP